MRKECPGLDDGGAGQSKYKGKYSRLPRFRAADGDVAEEELRHWWPALSRDIDVYDWCASGSVGPAGLGMWVCATCARAYMPVRARV